MARKPDESQSSFDFDRARRQTKIERVIIPRFERVEKDGTVRLARTGRIKFLLLVLERFARDGGQWSVGFPLLSQCIGGEPRTAMNTVRDAEQIGVVIVGRQDGRANTYQINWDRINELLLENPKTASLVLMPTKPVPKQSKKRSDTSENFAETRENSAATSENFADTSENYDGDESGRTTLSRVRGLEPSIQPCTKPEIKPSWSQVENHAAENSGSRPSGSSASKRPEPGFAGWPHRIELGHLNHPATVQSLWEHAVRRFKKPPLTPDLRESWFCLVLFILEETSQGKIRNPGGYFSKRVEERAEYEETGWLGTKRYADLNGTEDYTDKARKVMARLDCSKRPGDGPDVSQQVPDARTIKDPKVRNSVEQLELWAQNRRKGQEGME